MRPVILSRPANTAVGLGIFTAGISVTISSPGCTLGSAGCGGLIWPAPPVPGAPIGGTLGPEPGALATVPGGGGRGCELIEPGGACITGGGAPRVAVCGTPPRIGGGGGGAVAASSSISSG